MIHDVTWPDVAYTLIVTIPAIIAAYYGAKNHASLKTANGKTVGTIATETSQALQTGNEKTVGEMVTEVHGKESEQGTSFDTHA